VLEEQMNSLLMPAVGVVSDLFACYDPIPFGLVEDVAAAILGLSLGRRRREGVD
jgi:hypothetical protein